MTAMPTGATMPTVATHPTTAAPRQVTRSLRSRAATGTPAHPGAVPSGLRAGRRPGADDWYVVPVTGLFDEAAAHRVVRLICARLHLLDTGRTRLRHIAIDVSECAGLTAEGLEVLLGSLPAAAERGVGVHLVGRGALTHDVPLRARRLLHRFKVFPTLAAARAAFDH